MPAILLVMGKKEGCNKMNKKVHFVTAPFPLIVGRHRMGLKISIHRDER